jgi:hypothetical protein
MRGRRSGSMADSLIRGVFIGTNLPSIQTAFLDAKMEQLHRSDVPGWVGWGGFRLGNFRKTLTRLAYTAYMCVCDNTSSLVTAWTR